MRRKHPWWSGLVAAVLSGLVGVTVVEAGGEQLIALLGAREGAARFNLIPQQDGFIAYLMLLNARDGGINGVPLVWEECETVYNVERGVECYEHMKAKGASVMVPLSTPIINAVMARATQDQIPLAVPGLGRSDTAEGRVFPSVFPAPLTYWGQNTAKIRFIGQRVGGMAQLKGLKIVNIYHDSDYGRDTLALLDQQAAHYGFTVQHLAVTPPGLDQKATWLRVQVAQPDWVILRSVGLRSVGIMTATALKEAVQIGFPRDKILGNIALCSDQEVVPIGEAALGLICATWYGMGTDFTLIQDILHAVYAQGAGPGPVEAVGTGHWMRGLLRAVVATEGIRRAMREFGNQPMTGAQVQWGLEHLTLTAESLKAMGVEGLIPPFALSCRDHEGGGGVKFQQWDGKQWQVLTDWIAPDQALVRPLVEASAAKYAQEKGITLRDCP